MTEQLHQRCFISKWILSAVWKILWSKRFWTTVWSNSPLTNARFAQLSFTLTLVRYHIKHLSKNMSLCLVFKIKILQVLRVIPNNESNSILELLKNVLQDWLVAKIFLQMNAAPWLLSIRGEKLCCSCRLAFGLNVAQFEFETLGVSIPAISFSARTEAVVAFSSS